MPNLGNLTDASDDEKVKKSRSIRHKRKIEIEKGEQDEIPKKSKKSDDTVDEDFQTDNPSSSDGEISETESNGKKNDETCFNAPASVNITTAKTTSEVTEENQQRKYTGIFVGQLSFIIHIRGKTN